MLLRRLPQRPQRLPGLEPGVPAHGGYQRRRGQVVWYPWLRSERNPADKPSRYLAPVLDLAWGGFLGARIIGTGAAAGYAIGDGALSGTCG